METKTCSCTKSWGKYLADKLHAEYGGPCLPLGFANGSFVTALRNQPEKDWGKEFTAFVIQKECPTMKRHGDAPVIPKVESHEEMVKRVMDEMLMAQAGLTPPKKTIKKPRKNKTKK